MSLSWVTRQPHKYLDGTWHVSLVGRLYAVMCSFYRIFLADFIERIFYLEDFELTQTYQESQYFICDILPIRNVRFGTIRLQRLDLIEIGGKTEIWSLFTANIDTFSKKW
jgi:hypothetical protein